MSRLTNRMLQSPGRIVHAESEHIQIVRYSETERWYTEVLGTRHRYRIPVALAAKNAHSMVDIGDAVVYLDQPGGSVFTKIFKEIQNDPRP